jgi:hypothetical protein
VIRVARAAIRAPGNRCIGTKAAEFLGDALRHAVDERAIAGIVAQLAIGEAKQERRLDAQRLRGAARLFGALRRGRVPRPAR